MFLFVHDATNAVLHVPKMIVNYVNEMHNKARGLGNHLSEYSAIRSF